MADSSTLGLVIGSSVIAAIFTQGIGWARDWFKENKTSSYSALYLAMAFEAYGRACSRQISDSETYEASDGQAGESHGFLPEIPDLPKEIDWESLGIATTEEALALPVLVATTNSAIGSTWDIGEPEAALEQMREAAAEIGLKAFALAGIIRRRQKIPALAYSSGWSAPEHLAKRKAEYVALRDKREALHRASRQLETATEARDADF
jgi:hypothetical protein